MLSVEGRLDCWAWPSQWCQSKGRLAYWYQPNLGLSQITEQPAGTGLIRGQNQRQTGVGGHSLISGINQKETSLGKPGLNSGVIKRKTRLVMPGLICGLNQKADEPGWAWLNQ